ncbi:DUF559 domain-containing protein [Rhodococcus sp. ARC_M12]|nr:DUF559 domain-containing protein [Rhodococcus sp. ARC_M12]
MGVYTVQQLVAQGLSTSTISRRSQSGELVRLLPKVYATEKPDYFDLCIGATLWRPDAVLSHESAAWLWGLIDYEPRLVSVTVAPNTQSRSVPWIRIHRRRLLLDAVLHRGLRVVSLEQTFVDVATSLSTPDLEKFFDNAIDHHLPWRRVAALCDTAKGMHGMAAVRKQLRTCCPRTRSEPERVVARALTARHFTMEINARVGKFYGDLVDFSARVIVEIDGREFHTDPATFNNDRRRQNELVLDGWLVLRYSAATALADLDRVVDEIITVVRRRRKSIAATDRRLP